MWIFWSTNDWFRRSNKRRETLWTKKLTFGIVNSEAKIRKIFILHKYGYRCNIFEVESFEEMWKGRKLIFFVFNLDALFETSIRTNCFSTSVVRLCFRVTSVHVAILRDQWKQVCHDIRHGRTNLYRGRYILDWNRKRPEVLRRDSSETRVSGGTETCYYFPNNYTVAGLSLIITAAGTKTESL